MQKYKSEKQVAREYNSVKISPPQNEDLETLHKKALFTTAC